MSEDELIEFLKAEMELDVEYGEDGLVDIILSAGGKVVATVEICVN